MGRLARFFGGPISDWLQMECQESLTWVKVLEYLEAKEMLDAITVASFTKMTKNDRATVRRALEARMKIQPSERRALTTAEVAKLIKGR